MTSVKLTVLLSIKDLCLQSLEHHILYPIGRVKFRRKDSQGIEGRGALENVKYQYVAP